MHLTSDELELYAHGLLKDAGLAKVEEHLLVCQSCRKNLDEHDAEITALKLALDETELGRRRQAASSKGKLLMFKARSGS